MKRFKILPEEGNSFEGLALDSAWEELTESAWKMVKAIEDMDSFRLDKDSEQWLNLLSTMCWSILDEGSGIEYDDEGQEGYILVTE